MNQTINRFTPSFIKAIEPYQVFVFGSNEAGRHGKGAAKMALGFGAKYGSGVGHLGQTYAIPTKDSNINTLPITSISKYVDEFIRYAADNVDYEFLVTEIGCGLAGYTPEEIAPLFAGALKLYNVILPESFYNVLKNKK